MKSALDRELVENLNESVNQNFAETLNSVVYNLVETALGEIEQKSPFIKLDKCVMIPVGETYTGAFCQQSDYTYFLGIDNPTIAYNTTKKRNWWKHIWKTFKSYWRIGRKKKKKKKNEQEYVPITFEKYQIKDLKADLILKMSNYMQETSVAYEFPNQITLVGPEDFGPGVRVNIVICYYEGKTNTFKLYSASKNKFVDINFGSRFDAIDQKRNEVGEMFVNIAKIINQVFSKSFGYVPNQLIVESLLYSVPNNLYVDDDVYQTFVNVANYIRFKDPRTIPSIANPDKTFLKDKLTSLIGATTDYSRIVGMLDRYKY